MVEQKLYVNHVQKSFMDEKFMVDECIHDIDMDEKLLLGAGNTSTVEIYLGGRALFKGIT